MTDKTTHELRSGDRVDVVHGAESVVLVVDHDGGRSSARLTPAETMSLGTSLYFRGLGLLANAAGKAMADVLGPGAAVPIDPDELGSDVDEASSAATTARPTAPAGFRP